MNPFGFLNDTLVKTILLLVGGVILKRWPAFVNKAIPFASALLSAIIAALAIAFPTVTPDASHASFAFSSFGGFELYAYAGFAPKLGSFFANTFVPLAFAIASHSGSKNTREWLSLGAKFLWPGGFPQA